MWRPFFNIFAGYYATCGAEPVIQRQQVIIIASIIASNRHRVGDVNFSSLKGVPRSIDATYFRANLGGFSRDGGRRAARACRAVQGPFYTSTRVGPGASGRRHLPFDHLKQKDFVPGLAAFRYLQLLAAGTT